MMITTSLAIVFVAWDSCRLSEVGCASGRDAQSEIQSDIAIILFRGFIPSFFTFRVSYPFVPVKYVVGCGKHRRSPRQAKKTCEIARRELYFFVTRRG